MLAVLFMFRSDPRQKLAIVANALRDVANGKPGARSAATRKILFGWILYGMANELLSDIWANISRDDDDPEQWAWQDYDVHVHLIHHSRKLSDENTIPGKMDSKGSGAIVDQVDQCFTVWRNKKKEQQKQAGKEVDEKMPDAFVVCDKNRHGEWEGKVGLFYIPGACSYTEHPNKPMYHTYSKHMEVEGEPI